MSSSWCYSYWVALSSWIQRDSLTWKLENSVSWYSARAYLESKFELHLITKNELILHYSTGWVVELVEIWTRGAGGFIMNLREGVYSESTQTWISTSWDGDLISISVSCLWPYACMCPALYFWALSRGKTVCVREHFVRFCVWHLYVVGLIFSIGFRLGTCLHLLVGSYWVGSTKPT